MVLNSDTFNVVPLRMLSIKALRLSVDDDTEELLTGDIFVSLISMLGGGGGAIGGGGGGGGGCSRMKYKQISKNSM